MNQCVVDYIVSDADESIRLRAQSFRADDGRRDAPLCPCLVVGSQWKHDVAYSGNHCWHILVLVRDMEIIAVSAPITTHYLGFTPESRSRVSVDQQYPTDRFSNYPNQTELVARDSDARLS